MADGQSVEAEIENILDRLAVRMYDEGQLDKPSLMGRQVAIVNISEAKAMLTDLIDSAKREGAIGVRNLYGSPKCEALHHPKKYQHTAFEDCPVEKEINALIEQSEESI